MEGEFRIELFIINFCKNKCLFWIWAAQLKFKLTSAMTFPKIVFLRGKLEN